MADIMETTFLSIFLVLCMFKYISCILWKMLHTDANFAEVFGAKPFSELMGLLPDS